MHLVSSIKSFMCIWSARSSSKKLNFHKNLITIFLRYISQEIKKYRFLQLS
ncbi:unnamed protein product [Blumeria hordei]|uniref:Uncharacterized protein n=1 Tax=Blumeria hordei TaxID=2867405 RepID=A0A383UZ45_BLUHO|nr:unnamed protein product [Blumeria hordei]